MATARRPAPVVSRLCPGGLRGLDRRTRPPGARAAAPCGQRHGRRRSRPPRLRPVAHGRGPHSRPADGACPGRPRRVARELRRPQHGHGRSRHRRHHLRGRLAHEAVLRVLRDEARRPEGAEPRLAACRVPPACEDRRDARPSPRRAGLPPRLVREGHGPARPQPFGRLPARRVGQAVSPRLRAGNEMEVLGRRLLLPPARGRASQGRHARRADAEGGARPARHDPERHDLEAGARERDGLGPRPARPARGDAPEDGGACGREPLHDGRRLRHVPLRRPERRGPATGNGEGDDRAPDRHGRVEDPRLVPRVRHAVGRERPRPLAMGRLRHLPQLRDRVSRQPDRRRVPREQLLRPGRGARRSWRAAWAGRRWAPSR